MKMIEQESQRNNFAPFDLMESDDYALWREQKLTDYPESIDELLVPVKDPFHLTVDEREQILHRVAKANIAIYQTDPGLTSPEIVREMGKQLGLVHLDDNLCSDEDSISAICVHEGSKLHDAYIPYTNKALSWHTDGYYNKPEHRVRAIVMHCVNAAAEGGENRFLDHEILYVWLRDENPQWIQALMQEDVLVIPANVYQGKEIRPAQSGPVFYIDSKTGSLSMRYSARKRNIEWKPEALVEQATRRITELLESDTKYHFRYQPRPGFGIISNNVLHNRSSFRDNPEDNQSRCVYRARYYDRVKNT
jgi:hypothetical protein